MGIEDCLEEMTLTKKSKSTIPGITNDFEFASLDVPEDPCFKRLISWDLSHCGKKTAADDSAAQKAPKKKPA